MDETENDPFGVLNDLLGVLDASADVSPVLSLPPHGVKEHRNETRYMASWRVSVFIEGHDLHYGRVKDISLHGIAILNGLNIKPGTNVTLNIHISSLTTPLKPKALVVHGITSYAVHDAGHLCFRVGIVFVKFAPATDRAYLEERLTNHHSKAPDYVCQRNADQPISRVGSS
jgi:hypothetical protein